MIVAIMMGREGSSGFPGKNLYTILNRSLLEYPLLAAKHSKHIDEIVITTDSLKIKEIGQAYGASIIDRPDYLCTNSALGEDVFVHAYEEIKNKGENIEFIVLLLCNAATITADLIDEGIEILKKRPEVDSAVSVSRYNMWSPLRARKENEEGLLQPFVPFETFGDPRTLNCDRDSQGDVWFADMGVSIIRPHCLVNIEDGLLPQKWMGHKIYPLKQWGGCDVDYEWQIPGVEFWLKKHGFTETKTPYDK
ncbi:cytidylyltransferase [Desulfuribacillus stibiiarsenatis]|uniref:Cytidylyltransferase n=1 Tax=Desulfuribacillus stibiiarsenatis TaxID=1390249 RepID=A0A1E5L5V6_9FIRM|nr:cytidylyltransferase [Desulfuribacillus stibiiarsenatis]OEH85496.1 cytidylyltransferase [Desulfuribacillus stibiiarsenatis]